VLAKLAPQGLVLDRGNPQHTTALSRLRIAAEEAKIELTRAAEAPIFLAGVEADGRRLELDVIVTRSEYEPLIAPLIQRSLDIAFAGWPPTSLAMRQSSAWGPTVTPFLRERVRAVLGTGFGEGLDPMTLVAQGAALLAGTVALDGHPTVTGAAQSIEAAGPKVWLQFPAMTSDLSPFVVGKLLDPSSAVAKVRAQSLRRRVAKRTHAM
jgi:molecular chaperone DnaK